MPPEGQAGSGAGAGAGAGAGSGAGAGAGGAAATNTGAGAAGGNPGAGAAGTNVDAGGSAALDWTKSFNDDLKGYVASKGFKDSAQVVESYRQFEKSQGVPQDRILKLPEKADDPAWQEINYKLGVPKEAKEYQFEVPKEFGDEKFADTARDWFHKNGVPRTKAEAIVKSWNEYVLGKVQENKTNYANEVTKQTGDLKKEWGAAFDQNMEMGRRAAKAFGFDTEKINALEQALGYSGVMKFMHTLQTKVGEDPFVGGSENKSGFNGIMTPAQAQTQIKNRQRDTDFTARLLKKDLNAVNEWNELHKMAYPDPT